MLGRAHRFHGLGSLNGVYRNGKKIRGQMINLQHGRRYQDKPYRVAVVVSRKTHKSAVVRNRIRRRVYEVVRRNDEGLQNGQDLVFTVFSDQIATIEDRQLNRIIAELLKQAELAK